MFLSDISLPSKAIKPNFKNTVPIKKTEKLSNLPFKHFSSLKSDKSDELIDEFDKLIDNSSKENVSFMNENLKKNKFDEIKRFTQSLKGIPILDMDLNLRKLILNKYYTLNKKGSNQKTDTFQILSLFYCKTGHDIRYKFDVKNYFKDYIEVFYENWLNNCPDEIITCLEYGLLGF